MAFESSAASDAVEITSSKKMKDAPSQKAGADLFDEESAAGSSANSDGFEHVRFQTYGGDVPKGAGQEAPVIVQSPRGASGSGLARVSNPEPVGEVSEITKFKAGNAAAGDSKKLLVGGEGAASALTNQQQISEVSKIPGVHVQDKEKSNTLPAVNNESITPDRLKVDLKTPEQPAGNSGNTARNQIKSAENSGVSESVVSQTLSLPRANSEVQNGTGKAAPLELFKSQDGNQRVEAPNVIKQTPIAEVNKQITQSQLTEQSTHGGSGVLSQSLTRTGMGSAKPVVIESQETQGSGRKGSTGEMPTGLNGGSPNGSLGRQSSPENLERVGSPTKVAGEANLPGGKGASAGTVSNERISAADGSKRNENNLVSPKVGGVQGPALPNPIEKKDAVVAREPVVQKEVQVARVLDNSSGASAPAKEQTLTKVANSTEPGISKEVPRKDIPGAREVVVANEIPAVKQTPVAREIPPAKDTANLRDVITPKAAPVERSTPVVRVTAPDERVSKSEPRIAAVEKATPIVRATAPDERVSKSEPRITPVEKATPVVRVTAPEERISKSEPRITPVERKTSPALPVEKVSVGEKVGALPKPIAVEKVFSATNPLVAKEGQTVVRDPLASKQIVDARPANTAREIVIQGQSNKDLAGEKINSAEKVLQTQKNALDLHTFVPTEKNGPRNGRLSANDVVLGELKSTTNRADEISRQINVTRQTLLPGENRRIIEAIKGSSELIPALHPINRSPISISADSSQNIPQKEMSFVAKPLTLPENRVVSTKDTTAPVVENRINVVKGNSQPTPETRVNIGAIKSSNQISAETRVGGGGGRGSSDIIPALFPVDKAVRSDRPEMVPTFTAGIFTRRPEKTTLINATTDGAIKHSPALDTTNRQSKLLSTILNNLAEGKAVILRSPLEAKKAVLELKSTEDRYVGGEFLLASMIIAAGMAKKMPDRNVSADAKKSEFTLPEKEKVAEPMSANKFIDSLQEAAAGIKKAFRDQIANQLPEAAFQIDRQLDFDRAKEDDEKKPENKSEDDQENVKKGGASTLYRPIWLISKGETFVSIAENQFGDGSLAWLIADLNPGKFVERQIDGKRVIEIASRQKLELPVAADIETFKRSRLSHQDAENIVTIVTESQLDSEAIAGTFKSFLGTVHGSQPKQAVGAKLPALDLIFSDSEKDFKPAVATGRFTPQFASIAAAVSLPFLLPHVDLSNGVHPASNTSNVTQEIKIDTSANP